MPTVIDSLVVEVGLDPAKYRKGQKEIEETNAKTTRQLLRTGKDIEEQGKKSGESIGALKTNVLGLFAAFTGLGVTAFATQMIHADAATGRAAKTIDMSTQSLDVWESAAQRAGASTGELTGGFTNLTRALQTAALTGDASVGAKFKQLFGIDVVGFDSKLKSAAEIYLEIAEKAQGMDPAKASTAMAILGIPQGVIPLLLQGKATIEQIRSEIEKLGPPTDADAAAAVHLETVWKNTWKSIQGGAREFYPLIEQIGRGLDVMLSKQAMSVLKSFFVDPSSVFYKKLDKLVEYNSQVQAAGSDKRSLSQVGQGTSTSSLPAGGAFSSQAEKEAFIRAEAIKRGIDPNIAMAVAKSEGFYSFSGDQGTSFGAFQLHYKNNIPGLSNAGLGDTFTKRTGLDARDPKNEAAGIRFALDQAAHGGSGWAPWHGWTGSQFAGISNNSRSSSSSSQVHIGQINVYPPNGDAESIGKGIGAAIRRDMFAQQANDGPQ